MVKMVVNLMPVLKDIEKLNVKQLAATREGIKEATFFLEGEVKESISGNRPEVKRVDTGRYRASVHAEITEPYTGEITSNVEYAKHVEYGTTKMSPGRHFRNSMARNKTKIVKFIQKKIQDATK